MLQEKARQLEQKRAELAKLFKDNKNDKGELTLSKSQIDDVRSRNEELETLQKEYSDLEALVRIDEVNDAEMKRLQQPVGEFKHARPGAAPAGEPAVAQSKSVGDLFVESSAFKTKGAPAHLSGVDVKTLMETSAGYEPEVVRNRPVLLSAQRPITLLDVVPTRPITQTGMKYMEETTFTNGAAETAEGGTYGEAALAFTEKDSPVRKITVYLPVTDEQLEDVAYIRQYVNDRLGYMLRARLEGQVVTGNGSGQNLRGIMNFSGIQTQAMSTDPVFDAWLKAMTKVQTGPFAQPNVGLINPLDWQDIRLTRTADGIYILGNPGEDVRPVLFGLPMVQSMAVTQNTGIVQDTQFLELGTYRGVDVQISNSHADFFINGKQAIRADIRVAFHSYRPAATCTVTGI